LKGRVRRDRLGARNWQNGLDPAGGGPPGMRGF
jgi:hypothetical protein